MKNRNEQQTASQKAFNVVVQAAESPGLREFCLECQVHKAPPNLNY